MRRDERAEGPRDAEQRRGRARTRSVLAAAVWIGGALAASALASGVARSTGDGGDAYDRRVAALAERVASEPDNAALARAIAARLPDVGSGAVATRVRERLSALGLAPLRVPGLFYEQHPWTGADLSRIERWLGRPVAAVDTGEVAPVEENALRVRDAIRAAAQDGRRVVLFSASKGSADVQAALAREPALGACVAVWIDLVGVREGTPLTDPERFGAELVELGLPAETARSMTPEARAASARTPLAPEMRVVHVAGFPSEDAISAQARGGFERLRPLGPNDGFVLLDAYVHAPGRVVVVREADHYLRAPEIERRVLAGLDVVLAEIAARPDEARDARARCRTVRDAAPPSA